MCEHGGFSLSQSQVLVLKLVLVSVLRTETTLVYANINV